MGAVGVAQEMRRDWYLGDAGEPGGALDPLPHYLEYHLRDAWKLLFADEETPVAADPVAPATRSASVLRKARTGRMETGETVHSYQTLFKHLETLTRMKLAASGMEGAEKISRPTPLQARALELARLVPVA